MFAERLARTLVRPKRIPGWSETVVNTACTGMVRKPSILHPATALVAVRERYLRCPDLRFWFRRRRAAGAWRRLASVLSVGAFPVSRARASASAGSSVVFPPRLL